MAREKAGRASLKVPGGKLVTAKILYGGDIRRVTLTGDFFLHPEEGISAIESSIEGMAAGSDEIDIAIAVQAAIDENGIQAIGIDAASVARAVKMAMR
ncbi:MAG: hypothetical protein M1321_00760 [Candidatus Marsarchaeota archaeon]|jgi:lipoate-protein ligase A|nr:hypothetical protein [Candidatus Marsarchaeota archaeon]